MDSKKTLDTNGDILLQMTNISKEFPGVKALDGVHLIVRKGTVHALMGENGAGKSTLMKCLFGMYKRDSGEILLEGKQIDKETEEKIIHFSLPSHSYRVRFARYSSSRNSKKNKNKEIADERRC